MNSKSILVALAIVLGEVAFATAKEPLRPDELRKLADAAEAQARVTGCEDAAGVVDNLVELRRKPAFRALETAMVDSWAAALSNLDGIAADDMRKTIVLCSSWALPKPSFVAFLRTAVGRVEQGGLDRQVFLWCQWPLEGPLNGFLIRNHADPDVRDVIIRSRDIFKDVPTRAASYDRMLTGEALRDLTDSEFRQADRPRAAASADGQRKAVNSATARSGISEKPTRPEGRPVLGRNVLLSTVGLFLVAAAAFLILRKW
jgi:hypothetical protein